MFKTFVFTIPVSHTPIGQDYPELPASCCRIGVSEENSILAEVPPVHSGSGKTNNLVLVPNPASGFVNLLWQGEDAEFEVIDALGRVVVSRQPLGSSTYFETSELPSGLFQVRVIGNHFVETKPLQLVK